MISVTILTKNAANRLEKVLTPLKNFSEVLIYDTGSTDETLEIAKTFPNVSIHKGSLNGFGPTHNLASSLAKHDWILSIDSDEILSPELFQEISKLQLDSSCVYLVPRKNLYNEKWIRWCGWHPDHQIRLYHRKKTQFSDAKVHESVIADQMKKVILKSPLIHTSYESTHDFLTKMQSYSDLFAKQNAGKKSSSVFKACGHALFTFFKSYILKRGFLGGAEGFIISVYNANCAFYKYLKLWELNRSRSLRCPDEKAKSCSCSSENH